MDDTGGSMPPGESIESVDKHQHTADEGEGHRPSSSVTLLPVNGDDNAGQEAGGAASGHEYHDDDDDDDFNDCLEDDEIHNRYVDYSCATGWEYFINDIEEVLRRWWKEERGSGSSSLPPLCETISLDDTPYRFVWWRRSVSSNTTTMSSSSSSASAAASPTPPPSPAGPQLDDQSLDFCRRGEAENVQRWFGTRSFLFVWRPGGDDDGMDRSEAGLILSSLCIALHNCGIGLPVFVPVGKPTFIRSSAFLRGGASSATTEEGGGGGDVLGGFIDADEMIGYAVPGGDNGDGEGGEVPCTVRFETSKVFQPPEAYRTLDSFSELFLSKVGFATRMSGGGGGGGDGGGAMMGDMDGDGLRPRMTVNVEHSWLWEVRQHDWAIPASEWRDSCVLEPRNAKEEAARSIMKTIQGVLGLSGPLEGLGGLWGSSIMPDPLEHLCLRVRWMGLQDGTVVENVYYSTLQPLQTEPSAWLITALFQHQHQLIDSSSSGTAINKSATNSHKSAATPLPPKPDTCPLASLLQSLLASYITAKSVSPGTIMAELIAQKDGKPSPALDEEAIRQAVTIASHLGPSMSAHVKELSLRPPATTDTITRLITLLFKESDATTTFPPPPPSPSPWWEGDVSMAPPGRLVSLLSMAFARLQTLAGMAQLWVQVVQELRWRWDRGSLKVPLMEGIPPPFSYMTGAGQQPSDDGGGGSQGQKQCLIHQKLFLLNMCLERKGKMTTTTTTTTKEEEKEEKEEVAGDGDGGDGAEGEPSSAVVDEDDVFLDVVAEPPAPSTSLSFTTAGSEEEDHDGGDDDDDDVIVQAPPQSSAVAVGAVEPMGEGVCLLARQGVVVMVPECLEACPLTDDAYSLTKQLLLRLERDPRCSWEESLRRVHHKIDLPKLTSDIAAFKAANPGAVLADFVRWRLPEQWQENVVVAREVVDDDGDDGGEVTGEVVVQEEEEEGGKEEGGEGAAAAAEEEEEVEEAAPEKEEGHQEEGGDGGDGGDDAAPAMEEEDESLRLVWPGKGSVKESFAASLYTTTEEMKRLWLSTSSAPASSQKILFHVPQEAEKVLHYLETVSPGHLLCQVLGAAFSTAYYLLSEAQSDAKDLPELQADLQALRGHLSDCLTQLQAEQNSSEVISLDGPVRAQPVSQMTLTACQKVCTKIAEYEVKLGRATSLLHKLQDQPRLVSLLLSSTATTAAGSPPSPPPATPLIDESERRAILQLFGQLKADDTPPPSNPSTEATTSPVTPPTTTTNTAAEEDQQPPPPDTSTAGDNSATATITSSSSSSSAAPTTMLLPEDPDDITTTTTTTAPITTTTTATITKVERAHYILPPAGLRTYVLRCKTPTPYHHGLLGGPAGIRHAMASPQVPSRLYAVVNREEGSVRLALSLTETEF